MKQLVGKIIFLFITTFSISTKSDQLPRWLNYNKCGSRDKINILSVKKDKILWEESLNGKKIQKEKIVCVVGIDDFKKTKYFDRAEVVFKDDPILNGEVNSFALPRRVDSKVNLKHSHIYQAVIFPTKINCIEVAPENNFIVGRNRDQKNKDSFLRKDKKKYKDLFELRNEEVLLFEESGYSYYFYPPNYISKFKNLKDNKKRFEQTIYLFSMVIDNDLKLRYPSQKELFEKFELFKQDKFEKALDVESDSFFDDSCPKC